MQRGYLARFGYLTQGQPEVGNLLHGDSAQAQAYEDEFRIAIKTLQVRLINYLLTIYLSIKVTGGSLGSFDPTVLTTPFSVTRKGNMFVSPIELCTMLYVCRG